MVDIQDIIKQLLSQALKLAEVEAGEAAMVLEHPVDLAHGDYSCNIAMRLAKQLGKNPKELAEQIVSSLPTSEYIKKAEVAGPGFINFYLADTFFAQSLSVANKAQGQWGDVTLYKGKHMLIEHSSPNLFKPFHIGHLVNNTYGEALVRVVRAAGAEVTPLSFPSDVSPGIAKAVWGILDANIQDSFTIEQIGDAYVSGSAAYKSDERAKQRIDEINTNLYNQDETAQEWQVYEKGRAISLEYFKRMTARLGSTFDGLIFESESEVVGKEIVNKHTPKVFEESDGAIIFRGSEYGLFDNVYINSAGFGTYLAKDTGLLSIKFGKYKFDESITVTDIEQKQHFELVKKSAELINKEWADKSLYLQHGRLALTTGKISSRDGGVPLAVDILDTVKSAALGRAADSKSSITDEVAEQIAIGAIKYAIIRVGMGKNIVFDMEKSLSFEGDSGPYLQYTYARCKSVLSKSGNVARGPLATLRRLFGKWSEGVSDHKVQMPQGWQVTDIEQLLYRFPEVVERAALEYEPHYIANYLNELASAYNSWYAQGKILDGSSEQAYKLAITEATAHTIKNGLHLLGIDAPERM